MKIANVRMTTSISKSKKWDVRYGARDNELFDNSVKTRKMTAKEMKKYFGEGEGSV